MLAMPTLPSILDPTFGTIATFWIDRLAMPTLSSILDPTFGTIATFWIEVTRTFQIGLPQYGR